MFIKQRAARFCDAPSSRRMAGGLPMANPKSRFKYVPSFATDVRKTMKRERKRLECEKQNSNVSPISKAARLS
jgi:hypothetical protein